MRDKEIYNIDFNLIVNKYNKVVKDDHLKSSKNAKDSLFNGSKGR
jgi:hypothetical protein